jgi:hypothetical protein
MVATLFISLFVIFAQTSYSQDGATWLEYSTKGNQQATGHNFTVQYPPSYIKPTDFSKEEYLQTFAEEDEEGSGDNFYYLTAGIKNFPNKIMPSALKTEGVWDLKKLDQFWRDLAKGVPGVKTIDTAISWGNVPMLKLSTSEIKDDITSLSAILFALHGDKLIKLECGLNTFGADPEYANQDLTKEPRCHSYFSSLKFLDNPVASIGLGVVGK